MGAGLPIPAKAGIQWRFNNVLDSRAVPPEAEAVRTLNARGQAGGTGGGVSDMTETGSAGDIAVDIADLVATVEILTEYRRVARRLARQYPSVDVDPVLDLVIRESRIVRPAPVPVDSCDDEDDVKFLACAISGHATCVVSGDRALLRATGYEGIEVVTPRDFLTRLL